MAQSTLVISKNLTPYNIAMGHSLQLIHIAGGDIDTNKFVTVSVDGQSFEMDLFDDVLVEGKVITVMAKTLPNNTTWQFNFERIAGTQCDFEWGVQNGKTQKIYQGQSERSILIQGPPQDQENTAGRGGQQLKSILVFVDGLNSEVVVQGSSLSVIGKNIVITANQVLGDPSLTGKFTLLQQ